MSKLYAIKYRNDKGNMVTYCDGKSKRNIIRSANTLVETEVFVDVYNVQKSNRIQIWPKKRKAK